MSEHEPTLGEPPPTVDEVAVSRGGLGARLVAAGVGAALLVGGVAFAAAQAGSDDGSESPEEAVAQLFEALADEDLLGVLASLEPGERDTFREPMEDLFEELERLGVVDDSFELTGVPGLDLEFDGLTFRSEPVVDGITRVHLTSGTATYAVDGTELPVGDFLADTLDRFGIDPGMLQESGSEDGLGDDDTFLVARDTGDGWRVSIGYTAAEAARESMGRPVPASGMDAIGADSPEAAVEGVLRAAADLDLPGVVARLSPHELGALHRYWPVLVDEDDLPSAEELGATIEITELELDADTDGDRARVFIRRIGVDVTAEDFRGGGTVADGCVTLRGDALEAAREELDLDDDTICQGDVQAILEEAMGDVSGSGLGFGLQGSEDLVAPGLDPEQASFGITATEVDGRWYVAPIRTVADLGIEVLRTVEREDLEAAVDAIEGFFGGAFFGGGMVGEGFVPPGLTDDLGGFEDLEGSDLFEEGWSEYEELEQEGVPVEPAPGG